MKRLTYIRGSYDTPQGFQKLQKFIDKIQQSCSGRKHVNCPRIAQNEWAFFRMSSCSVSCRSWFHTAFSFSLAIYSLPEGCFFTAKICPFQNFWSAAFVMVFRLFMWSQVGIAAKHLQLKNVRINNYQISFQHLQTGCIILRFHPMFMRMSLYKLGKTVWIMGTLKCLHSSSFHVFYYSRQFMGKVHVF